MPIEVTCPCGRRFRAGEARVGQEVPCPGCQKTVRLAGPTVPPFDVFVSYSSKDHAVANAVVATLEARGLRCWVAPRDIVPGKEWSEAIIEGIGQCRIFALIFSANSNASQQVVREVERAVNRKMPVIPFRVEDLLPSKSMEYFISSCHWLDAFHPPLDEHLDKLADTCQALLTGAAPSREQVKGERKGLVRAAAGALLARDHRARLLVALTLACLFIGTLVVAALYLLRDPKASPAVVEARVAAENALASAQKATAGQGVEGELQAVETALRTAQGHFEQKRFDQAKAGFEEVGRLAAEATALGETKQSRADFEEVTKRIDGTSLKVDEGAESWKASERLAREAEGQRRFAEATKHYRQARQRFEKQALPQLRYLWFWAGYAPRVMTFARLGDQANDRLRKMGGFAPDGAPFPTRKEAKQAWEIFESECVPQLRIDAKQADAISNGKDPDKLSQAFTQTYKDVVKRFGPDADKWLSLGYSLASLTGFLAHHTTIGTEISPYRYLKYVDPWGPQIDLLAAAFLVQRLDVPPEARVALLDAALQFAHVAEAEVTFGYAGPQSAYRLCLERYRKFAGEWLKDGRSAAAFLSRSTPRPTKFSDEQWKRIVDHTSRGVHVLIFPGEKGDLVSWVFAPTAKRGTDLVEYLATLPPVYRLDLGANEINPEIAKAVLDRVATLTGLQELSVHGVSMTDAQLVQVGKSSGLRRLTLWYFKAQALEPLAGLKDLRVLSLYDVSLGNDALKHLAGLTNLEELYLGGKDVTFEGLSHLKGLKQLKTFAASGVNPKDLDEFRAEIPGLARKQK